MSPAATKQKTNGAYYTPRSVAETLVRWVVRSETDRLFDPSCGDGRFLDCHRNGFGVEFDPSSAAVAARTRSNRTIHVDDFFEWAERTKSRFDCAAGNPPFIRYQRFSGDRRARALKQCRNAGMTVSGLTSSWAPFLVVTADLLRRGGRMAFVVPAEIGHASYARDLFSYFTSNFGDVRVVALRESVFPDLSQDVWLLYAAEKGERSTTVRFSALDRFTTMHRPPRGEAISLSDLKDWRGRLRPFILRHDLRDIYRGLCVREFSTPLGDLARVGIGYVTGANDFFHLRPSEARRLGIPKRFLIPSVRNGRSLNGGSVSSKTIDAWDAADAPYLLLRISKNDTLPRAVRDYLDSTAGRSARSSYKCRKRTPWYVVPDVTVPDAFLTYMSGHGPSFVTNDAQCACTNSIHAVRLIGRRSANSLAQTWQHELTRLSCELEGHPLGGGMLKIEPREAARVRIPQRGLTLSAEQSEGLNEATFCLRKWRHYA